MALFPSTLRGRKLVAAFTLIPYMFLYAIAAMALVTAFGRPPLWAEPVIYLALGLVWILPLKPFFKWIGRGV